MDENERQRQIKGLEEMERLVSYGPDKAALRRQADALRTAAPPSIESLAPKRRWF